MFSVLGIVSWEYALGLKTLGLTSQLVCKGSWKGRVETRDSPLELEAQKMEMQS